MKPAADAPLPIIRRPRRWSLIWVVPAVTLLLSGWLVWREMRRAGPVITITFQDGSGIDAERTRVMHKGVTIGTVRAVSLDPSLQSVRVEVELARSAKALARQGTKFWVVRPEVSLQGITGLGSLLSGPWIAVLPGEGAEQKEFQGLPSAPRDPGRPTRAFVLRAPDARSVKPNSPVYYRGVETGYVSSLRLSDNANTVLVEVRILEPYHKLVRTRTQFWNASGFDVKVGLTGAKIESESLQSIIAGGIVFATPDEGSMGPEALENTEFDLHPRAEPAWEQWRPAIPLGETPSIGAGK